MEKIGIKYTSNSGEIRNRERALRTLEKSGTQIFEGYDIFHNYIRPHQSLRVDTSAEVVGMQILCNYVRPHVALVGKTPAEMAGVKIERENKWVTVIRNGAKSRGEHDYSRKMQIVT